MDNIKARIARLKGQFNYGDMEIDNAILELCEIADEIAQATIEILAEIKRREMEKGNGQE